MIVAGIDAGSRTIKVVLFDTDKQQILGSDLCDQGVQQAELAEHLFEEVLQRVRLDREDVTGVVATGYGRNAIDFADKTVTEITCHAKGVCLQKPDARTIIDIGGEDSKVIKLDAAGKVQDFAMNDRCAAGTGRFLEVVAARLESQLHELGHMASHSQAPAAISSMCVVFAETEIIGLLASGAGKQDIAAGVQQAIATRINSMMGRQVNPPILFTGGVALVPGMRGTLEQILGQTIEICPEAQFTGALGAAILASKN
jgi:(R)-2-hydroxyacyl-CoA dehydratese activating ATPase